MKPNNIYQYHQKYYTFSKGLKEYAPFSYVTYQIGRASLHFIFFPS